MVPFSGLQAIRRNVAIKWMGPYLKPIVLTLQFYWNRYISWYSHFTGTSLQVSLIILLEEMCWYSLFYWKKDADTSDCFTGTNVLELRLFHCPAKKNVLLLQAFLLEQMYQYTCCTETLWFVPLYDNHTSNLIS